MNGGMDQVMKRDRKSALWRHGGLLRTLAAGTVALTLLAACGCQTTTVPPASLSLQDFAGNWVVLATAGKLSKADRVLRLRLNGSRLSGTIDGQSGRADLGSLLGDTVSGSWLVGSSAMPMTAQINADGDRKQLTLTVAPPESEYITATAWKEGRALANGTIVKLPSSPVPVASGPVKTPDDAIQRVAALPAVAAWVQKIQAAGTTSQAILDVDSETKTSYVVHAYEFMDDGGGRSHTVTFGWYEVDRTTGAIHKKNP